MSQADTREQILRAAGPIFADKGYQRATVREICQAAGVNVAAINYYFGDKRQLYIETVTHAHRTRVEQVPLPAWTSETTAAQKLRDFIGVLVSRMVGVERAPWETRLMLREVLQPTEACRQLVEQHFRPQFQRLLDILEEIVPAETSLQERQRIAFSIVGQCVYYRVAGDIVTMLVSEDEVHKHFTVDHLADHIATFSLRALGLDESQHGNVTQEDGKTDMNPRHSRVGDFFRILLPLVILCSGIGIAVAAVIMRPRPPQQDDVSEPPKVELAPIASFREGFDIDVDGTVVPFREIAVAAEVAGRIKTKTESCRAGRAVQQGCLLLEIDQRDYKLTISRLTKEQKRAEVNLTELKVQTENNERLIQLADQDLLLQSKEVGRLRDLIAARVVTDSELDSARRSEVGARNAVELLKNRTRLLEAQELGLQAALELAATQLEKAQLDLQRTKIISPVDGVVVTEHVEEDSYVQPGATVVTIEDTSAAEVRCMLRTDQLYWLWQSAPGDGSGTTEFSGIQYELPQVPATVTYHVADQQFTWEAVLSRYEGIGLDAKTRTVPCRVLVPDPTDVNQGPDDAAALSGAPPALVRGMFVNVRLHVQPSTRLLALPEAALQPGNNVWLCRDGKLQVVPVRTVRLLDDRAIIHANPDRLSVGDQLVVTPLATAFDGMSVTPVGNRKTPVLTAQESDTRK